MKCGCFSYYLLLFFVLWIDGTVFANIQGYSLLTEDNKQISVNRCRTPTCEVIEYLGDKELSKNVPTFYTPISGLQVDPYNQNTAACTGLLCGANAACDPSSGDIAMNNFAACSGACCAANSGCITVNPYTQCQGANFRIEQCLGLPYGSTSSGGYGFGSSAGGWGQGRNGGGFGVQGGGCGYHPSRTQAIGDDMTMDGPMESIPPAQLTRRRALHRRRKEQKCDNKYR
eukprot:TRINITY_DN3851_c0_g1_i11.p2 TRINITY_DN3851_c0_g1~~TRINITY_DN3851_c0_g1_i11.p2  ORF type:complete len:229 (+),score=17.96 TRINITY_DN3851_c0_g1_i11:30-716(+)